MPVAKPSNTDTGAGIFQIDPEQLFSTYPQFYAASEAISNAASSLSTAVASAAAAWDGDSQKKVQSLGNEYVKNLQALADAMNTIAGNLNQTFLLINAQELRLKKHFDIS